MNLYGSEERLKPPACSYLKYNRVCCKSLDLWSSVSRITEKETCWFIIVRVLKILLLLYSTECVIEPRKGNQEIVRVPSGSPCSWFAVDSRQPGDLHKVA
jgi:hypothetical protein